MQQGPKLNQSEKSPSAERSRRHRLKIAANGMKKFRGSLALHPSEHDAVCAVVAWIEARRTDRGMAGSMLPLRLFLMESNK